MNIAPAHATSPVGYRVAVGSLELANRSIADAKQVIANALNNPSSSDHYDAKMRETLADGGALPTALALVRRAADAVHGAEPESFALANAIRSDVHAPLAAAIEGARQVGTWKNQQYVELRIKLDDIAGASSTWADALRPSGLDAATS